MENDIEAINQARKAVEQARLAAHIPQAQAPQPSKPVVIVKNGQMMLDTYSSNTNKLYTNSVLRPNRFIPMVTSRTQTIAIKSEQPQVSNSTTFGTGIFQGKLSIPVKNNIILR
jgi:hypothetical protein